MSDDFLWDLLSVAPAGPHGRDGGDGTVANDDPAYRDRLPWRSSHIVCALIVGVLFDAGMRADQLGLGASLGITVAGLGVLAHRPNRTRERIILIVGALALGWCIFLRSSAWLSVPTFLVSGHILVLAATPSTRPGGRIRSVVRRGFTALLGFADSSVDLWHRVVPRLRARPGRDPRWPLVRGVLFAVPVVLVLGALLASGDAVFADSLSIRVPSVGRAFAHVVTVLVGVYGAAGLFASSFLPPVDEAGHLDTAHLRPAEGVIILGSVAALYGLFAGVQLYAAIAGAEHVRATTGLTYAEYARSGFFQLLTVSVLTLFLLGLTRFLLGSVARVARPVLATSATLVFLTLVVVGVAFRRMALYEHAYGFTMRRLLPHIVIVLIGFVFVLLGISYIADLRIVGRLDAGPTLPAARSWLIPTVGFACVAVLIGCNVANLESVVARSQLERAARGGDVDAATREILGLGTDAVPVVIGTLKRQPSSTSTWSVLRNWACTGPGSTDWAGRTWSATAASSSRQWCARPTAEPDRR